jgi:exosortase
MSRRRSRSKDSRDHQSRTVSRGDDSPAKQPEVIPPQPPDRWALILAGVGLLAAFLWSYWPTLREIVATWEREPDYSHGFLVAPIALFFVWVRRDSFPKHAVRPSWTGLLLLSLAVVPLRMVAGFYYFEALDGWTIPLWVAGAVWLTLGWQALRWCLPSVIFLFFMIPLPYGAEHLLSLPLQTIATKISTVALTLFGQPAIAEGHTIWIRDNVLEVAEACSGLRILVGIVALAFAFVLFSRWAWWQKVLAVVAAIPIAIAANAIRVVGTGILMANFPGEAAQKLFHDLAGWLMIPLAAALFWLFLVYLERLFPLVHEVRPSLRVE